MSRFPILFPRHSSRPQHGPSRPRACRLEPLEDRRLLSVASFQDGVFPTPEYDGTRDAPIFAADADVNFGGALTLRADAEQSSTGQPAWSLFKWDPSSIPAEATINDASLTVNITNTTAEPGFHLFEVKTPWLESEVTWNGPDGAGTWEDPGLINAIDAGDVILATLPGTELGPLSVSLTAEGVDVVRRWIADPSSNHGFLLSNPDNTNSVRFNSREGATAQDRPKLTIDFDYVDTEPPTATLVFPADNGPADQNPSEGEVRAGLLDRIVVRLSDFSLDDATVAAETVRLTTGGQPVPDVAFSFDAATDLVTLTPAVAPFPAGDYLVTLNGGDAKIADTAGNPLPLTVFTIQFDATLPSTSVARDDSYETNEGAPLVVGAANGVLANDYNANAPQWTAVLVQAPQHGALFLGADGSFIYLPTEGFSGSDAFTYRAGEGAFETDVATVVLSVVRLTPLAIDDTYETPPREGIVVAAAEGVLANDSDPQSEALTANLLSGSGDGTLALEPDGSFTDAPDEGVFWRGRFHLSSRRSFRSFVDRHSDHRRAGSVRSGRRPHALSDPAL